MRSFEFQRNPSVPYVAPFAVFMALLVLGPYLPPAVDGPWRAVALTAVLWFFSRKVVRLKARLLVPCALLGVFVFLLWIAPDTLMPHYRDSILFQNRFTGTSTNSIPKALLANPWILFFRVFRSVALVPVIEELFWRAWLMRWLIDMDFERVPLGAFSPFAFIATAVLFSMEHGPYWDVGLLTGFIYNWWMVRTRSLGDCILVHAVTNACLAGFVIATNRWEYWL